MFLISILLHHGEKKKEKKNTMPTAMLSKVKAFCVPSVVMYGLTKIVFENYKKITKKLTTRH